MTATYDPALNALAARVQALATRAYGNAGYRLEADGVEAVLYDERGVVYRAHAMDGNHLGALMRHLERRAEGLS